MVTVELVLSVFAIACSSIGKAALVVAAGTLLTRRGAFSPDVRRGLSKAAASLLVPCLLVDRLARTVTPTLLAEAWPIIPFGTIYVALGCGLGALSTLGTASVVRKPAIAATAFANSQAMPIILIEVIGPELFGPAAAATGVTYIGLYVAAYLVLQWTIGAALLDVPFLSVGGGEKPALSEAASHARSDGGGRCDIGNGHDVPSDGIALSPTPQLEAGDRDGEGEQLGAVAHGRVLRAEAAGSATLLTLPSGKAAGTGVGGRRRRRCTMACCAVIRRVASPPIYGILAGLVIALVPPLRWLLVDDPAHGGSAPLRFVLQAAGLLGNAAIPLNTMLLGASLSKGPTWRAVPTRVVTGVVLSKLAVMPAAALALGALLRTMVPELPPLLMLVILMESAMPTANNLMMMCELGVGGKSSALMSTLIFVQYMAAPVLLTASLTAFMAFVQQGAPGHAGQPL